MSEFSISVRLFLKTYQWRQIDPVPWTALRKPLAGCRVAAVSSAGQVLPEQKPFDDSIKGGDPGFREIPDDADLATLVETHRSKSFDHSGVRQDPNLAFPLERLRELKASKRIGGVNQRHISFMGSLTATGSFLRDTVPAIADRLTADAVDVALLVPV